MYYEPNKYLFHQKLKLDQYKGIIQNSLTNGHRIQMFSYSKVYLFCSYLIFLLLYWTRFKKIKNDNKFEKVSYLNNLGITHSLSYYSKQPLVLKQTLKERLPSLHNKWDKLYQLIICPQTDSFQLGK